MSLDRTLLQLLSDIRERWDSSPSLDQLAVRSGWSASHLHRAFRRVVGETPKQYTLRLRLERAAAMLATQDDTVFRVAAAAGFSSHEVFTRAFRRYFRRTPVDYRAAALIGASADDRARHCEVIDATGPCIGLFHTPINHPSRRFSMPTLSIARQQRTPQPVFFVRLRAARHELPSAIAEGVGKAFRFSQQAGVALAGPPFTRYLSSGLGLMSIEVGLPLAAPARGDAEVEASLLSGGPVAVAIHAGPYDQLGETYAALERWIEAGGFRVAGPPWESYVTDPADHPDPADWRTEVNWPLAE